MGTQYLNHKTGQIAYDDSGAGPLVVCVPSMGDVRGEYRFLKPYLVEAGYRVVTMDVRGHGETSTEWDDFSVAGVGEDILALIRRLNAGPAVLIGASMAAGAGVWAAAENPGLIRGLVLIGPFVDGEGSFLQKLMFSALITRPWGPAMWQSYYTRLYPTCKPADFPGYAAALRENLSERGRLEALRHMLNASKKASGDRLSQVDIPVLVLMGRMDPDFKHPEEEARRVAEALRGRYTLIDDAGHYPHAEMPEQTAPLVISFLDSLAD